MGAQTIPQAENLQDSLRTMRGFVSNIGGYMVDQSMAQLDSSVRSSPYQYQTVTAQGTAIEGSRSTIGKPMGPVQPSLIPGVSNLMLLVGAAMFVLVLRK